MKVNHLVLALMAVIFTCSLFSKHTNNEFEQNFMEARRFLIF